jgi:hypothetical protein
MPHGADPPPHRVVPAQGAPHPHHAQGARPRLAALWPLHQARHPQASISSLPPQFLIFASGVMVWSGPTPLLVALISVVVLFMRISSKSYVCRLFCVDL